MDGRKCAGERSSFVVFCVVATVAVLSLPVAAKDAVILVHPGAMQTWQGFGGSAYPHERWYDFPEDKRSEMVKLAYGDLEFRFIRLWAGLETNADSIVKNYDQYVKDVKKVRPDIRLLLAPCANVESEHMSYPLADYAKHYATMIKELKDNHDMNITTTGIMNEPNAFGRLLPNEVPLLVKLFRQEMDARGLEDVKIIAPECSMVDDGCEDMIDALIADKDALDVLDGFSTHCYGMCLRHYIVEKEWPYKKEHWQTESSSTGFGTAALTLSDMNLGTTHWTHFFAFYDQGGDAERFAVIGYTKPSGNYVIYPQFYFYKQLLPTFPVGTVMRFCESNVESWDGERFEYMENTYGDKPPLCAAAGWTPDGHLSLAVVNNSQPCPGGGCTAGAKWYPPTDFNVQFQLEELVEAGTATSTMAVHKVTNSSNGAQDAGTAELKDGQVTVTVKPGEMLTLTSTETVAPGENAARPRSRPAAATLRVAVSPSRSIIVDFGRVFKAPGGQSPASVALHATDGSLVRRVDAGSAAAAGSPVVIDGSALPCGLYLLRAERGDMSRTAALLIR